MLNFNFLHFFPTMTHTFKLQLFPKLQKNLIPENILFQIVTILFLYARKLFCRGFLKLFVKQGWKI